jgi:predicted Zn-dependent protease with MMP-like domain/Flp pilus assembly protein TadD
MARRPGGPDDADPVAAIVDRAGDALEDGRPEDGLALADEAIAAAPRSVPALHLRAAALAELGRTDEAIAAYERAVALGKDDPELHFAAAQLFVDLGSEADGDRELVERGLGLARRGTKLARRAGDTALAADLAWLEGVALNQLGRCEEALARLAEAERAAPDSPDVQLEKGLALYELCRFDEAREALLRAEALDPDDAWTQHQLGLVAERQGRRDEARRRLDRARKLAPEDFPRPIALSTTAFDAAVEDALRALPGPVRRYLSNVAITVEDVPSDHDLLASDPPLSPAILGLFRGAPYGQKASMDPWSHFPSSIVLYQKNLERFARSREELIDEIRVTLQHEIGHFLGLDEDDLYARGLD